MNIPLEYFKNLSNVDKSSMITRLKQNKEIPNCWLVCACMLNRLNQEDLNIIQHDKEYNETIKPNVMKRFFNSVNIWPIDNYSTLCSNIMHYFEKNIKGDEKTRIFKAIEEEISNMLQNYGPFILLRKSYTQKNTIYLHAEIVIGINRHFFKKSELIIKDTYGENKLIGLEKFIETLHQDKYLENHIKEPDNTFSPFWYAVKNSALYKEQEFFEKNGIVEQVKEKCQTQKFR